MARKTTSLAPRVASRYRWSIVNATIVVLSVACAVGVVALVPGVPPTIRALAGIGLLAILLTLLLVVRYALAYDGRRLALFAAIRGWSLSTTDEDLAARFSTFPFRSGLGDRVVNVVRGSHRFHDCATFTLRVSRPVPQFYQVTFVELDARVPAVELLPEDALAAAKKLVGGQDLMVGEEEFDATWRIVAEDPEFARRLLTPELRRFLLRRRTRGMPIAIASGAVLTWEAGPRGVRSLSKKLDVLIEVMRLVPEDLWTGRPSPSVR